MTNDYSYGEDSSSGLEYNGSEETDKLFVGGLSKSSTIQTIFDYFSQFGQMLEVDCKMDPHTGNCRGFGFVHFAEASSVALCLAEGTHWVDGKAVEVKPHNVSAANTGGGGGGIGSRTSPCKHFQQGRCTYGDQCGFSHDPDVVGAASPAAPSQSTVVCRHWLQGRCTFGDACSFKHHGGEDSDHNPGADRSSKPQLHAAGGNEPNALAAAGIDVGEIIKNVQNAIFAACGDQHSEGLAEHSFTEGLTKVNEHNGSPAEHNFTEGWTESNENSEGFTENSFTEGLTEMNAEGLREMIQKKVRETISSLGLGNPGSGKGKHKGGASTLQSAGDPPAHLTASKPCRHFAMGRCHYGDLCQFRHDQSPVGGVGNVVQATGWKERMQEGCAEDSSQGSPCTDYGSWGQPGVSGGSRYTPY